MVESYVKVVGLWVDSLEYVEYECVLEFDFFSVECNLVGFFNLYCCLLIKDLSVCGIVIFV